MKKVLVTGGSHAELPLIKALHDMGYYVITTGNDEKGLGHLVSDKYCKGDYSDKEYVLRLAIEEQVCGIVSGCNDFAYISTAYACERLGLSGHDSYEKALMIHQKNQFRNIQKKVGLPYPKYKYCFSLQEVAEYAEEAEFPLLIKPIDLTGGKGIQICNNVMELTKAYDIAAQYTRQKGVLVEQYIKGKNHGVSTLVHNHKVQFAFFDNEQYYLNPYLVAGACTTEDIHGMIKEKVIDGIEKIVKYCDLCDGLFHCQLIITDDGLPYMIDPCRRSPGDLYIQLVEYATGIPYPETIVKYELGMGENAIDPKQVIQKQCIARECIMTDKNGIIKQIKISENYQKYIFDSIYFGKKGDRISDYLKYKVGILFMRFDSPKEMQERIEKLYDNVQICLDEEGNVG